MANLDEELVDACLRGMRARAESLLDEGANIEHPGGRQGRTPIILASSHGHLDVVKMLHGRGANVNFQATRGENALMFAAAKGRADVATFLVTDCGADASAVDNIGWSALHRAAQGGFLDVVKKLQTHGADLHALTNRGDNALMIAARGGHLDIVTYLAGQGVNTHVLINFGENAIVLAALGGHLDIVTWLADQGVDINALTNDGFNALMMAAQGGCLDIVTYLAGQGLDTRARNNGGVNALMLASIKGQISVATFLITECGADVSAVDNGGFSALHRAVQGGFLDIVKMLQGHGANLHALTNNRGVNALMWAASWGQFDVVTWLVGQGANIHAITNAGTNALIFAAYNDHPDVCTYLISLGLDPALKDRQGESTLTHYAKWLEADSHGRLENEQRPSLTKEEKQARVKLLTDARAEYLELQRREECYQRRKVAITFLQGSGFLLTAAQRKARKAEEAQVDTHAKLAAIDRSTKEANLKYLTDRVFGEDKGRHLGREIVMML